MAASVFFELPTANRQWTWYHEAYPEAEMRECSFPNCRELETQGHMFACKHHPISDTTSVEYSQALWQPLAELVTETLHTGRVFLGMTDEMAEKAKRLRDIEHQDERTALELRKHQNGINDKRYIKELERLTAQREKQLTLCVAELQAQCYEWGKVRHEAQIDREFISSMTPEQRRRIMKRPKHAVSLLTNPRADENDGIPKWPRTTKCRETEMRHSNFATNRALFNRPVGRV